jgi:hypothetical protein
MPGGYRPPTSNEKAAGPKTARSDDDVIQGEVVEPPDESGPAQSADKPQ